MHFGLLPRANRGIFAINELPDLSGKVQVGLFNIMQEGDVQIKGYPVRLPLDVLLAFTANPEDYTARGKIITPLKDRIGSEIITHYPRTVAAGHGDHRAGGVDRAAAAGRLEIPDFVLEVIERVAFEAREDKRVDKRSGVSQRLPISVLENAVSNAERRAMSLGEERGRAADQRRVRGGALDHRQARAGVRGRAAGRRHHRARADPPRRRHGARGAGRRRRPRPRSWPGSTRAARSRCRATSGPSSAIKGFAVVPGLWSIWCASSGSRAESDHRARGGRLRAGARGPGRAEADQPERGAGLHPGAAGTAGAGVRQGGNLVRMRWRRSVTLNAVKGTIRSMAPFASLRVTLQGQTHPSALALPTITSAAPSSPSAAVFSTR